MIFDNYARYYDLFYQEKDYLGEIAFLEAVGRFEKGCSILDLGCGTGNHDIPLAMRGYRITGVDIAENMVNQAQKKASEQNVVTNFLHGDIRSIRLDTKFDNVISMFAVMGYQTSNDDFSSTLQTAREHLNVGGLFIFDAWFGPAALTQRPETRITEMAAGNERIIRIARPELNILANTVTVNYTILRLDQDKVLDETRESHSMRYLFASEVSFFAEVTGFTVELVCPFLEPGSAPTINDWNVTWALRAV